MSALERHMNDIDHNQFQNANNFTALFMLKKMRAVFLSVILNLRVWFGERSCYILIYF